MRRLHLIANSKSGQGHGESLALIAEKMCRELGAELITYPIDSPDQLTVTAKAAALAAKNSTDDVVVAAGGDGTIRSIAQEVSGTQIKFAVIPCGTFNFFARSNRIPEDAAEALRLAITGTPKPVRLGEINGLVFTINASIGLYAKAIAERAAHTKRFGRWRAVAMASTLRTLLRAHKLLHVKFSMNDQTVEFRTSTIFIGNSQLQLEKMALSSSNCFSSNKLAVIALKPVKGWKLIRVITRGIVKTLEHETSVDQFCIDNFSIDTEKKSQQVALDGEIFRIDSPFKIKSLPTALSMIVPSRES